MKWPPPVGVDDKILYMTHSSYRIGARVVG